MSEEGQPDRLAVRTAEQVHRSLHPQATFLFGSRARGDHREDSDLDLLLVTPERPSRQDRNWARGYAERQARADYGREMEVNLIWIGRSEFDREAGYLNTMCSRAMLEGTLFSDSPEDFRSRYEGPDATAPRYDWEIYEMHLRNARIGIDTIRLMTAALDGKPPGETRVCMPREIVQHMLENNDPERSIIHGARESIREGLRAAIWACGQIPRDRDGMAELAYRLAQLAPQSELKMLVPPETYEQLAGLDGMDRTEFARHAEADALRIRKLAIRLRRRTGSRAGGTKGERNRVEHGTVEHGTVEHGTVEHGTVEHGTGEPADHNGPAGGQPDHPRDEGPGGRGRGAPGGPD